MQTSSVEVWLWLLLVMNPHNPKTAKLLEKYGSAESLCRAIRDGECRQLNDAEKQRARNTRTREVRQIMEECAANSIRIITLDDPEYPSMLKNIYSPPIVLFVRGTLECLSGEVPLAVVGPRRPSEYAVRAARMLCGSLAKIGTVMVSGLAVGIDTIVHSCAVDCGVPTIGVLACGQLVNYPAENEELKRRIATGGGAVISELLPHAEVTGAYFHERNRIISGLGLGTLVIEASTRSGCLLTANHAIEQGRDLFCVPPGDITKESCAGVVPYLRDGAIPVFDYLDIVHEYMYHYFNRINPELLGDKFHLKPPPKKPYIAVRNDKPEKSAKTGKPLEPENTEDNPANPKSSAVFDEPKTVSEKVYEQLNEIQARLLRLVAEQPRTADELIELTRIPYAQTAEALTELEILGHIQLQPDGRYSLV